MTEHAHDAPLDVDSTLRALATLEKMPDEDCRRLAAAVRAGMQRGSPIVAPADLRHWRLGERNRHLRIAHRHAAGETAEARMRALREEIARILRGDLRRLGEDAPATSRMRTAILAAKEHGPIVFEERHMRRILSMDIDHAKDVHDPGAASG